MSLTLEKAVQGHVRQGFPGVADTTAWFSQVDEKPTSRDEFRVAQLFRPTAAARPIFRLVVALMRGKGLGFGSLLLWSFGWVSRLLTLLILFGAPTLLAFGPGVKSSLSAQPSSVQLAAQPLVLPPQPGRLTLGWVRRCRPGRPSQGL